MVHINKRQKTISYYAGLLALKQDIKVPLRYTALLFDNVY
jgi:hypothetical protein